MKSVFLLIAVVFSSQLIAQSLIRKNGSFDYGLNGWEYGVVDCNDVGNKPAAEFKIDQNSHDSDNASCKVKVKISTASKSLNDVYLIKRQLPFKKGKKYRVIFYVKSNRNSDKVEVSIGSGKFPRMSFITSRGMKFIGDGEWKKISLTLQIDKKNPKIDYNDLSLVVGFNHRFGTFYVDDFSIKGF